MISLSETLENVRTKIAKHKGKNLCEADTKAALINPVLGALGWHVGNLDEVSMEFKHATSHNPVDYALLISGNPTVLVEAKALGQSLAGGKWADQIMGYAGTSGVKWVVLTNGDEYRIFNALVEVPFSQKLFREVRLTDPNSPVESTLALLSKERIDDIGVQWQIHFADRQVYAAIEKLFSPVSAKTLAHFVKKHVKGLTAKEIHASLARVCAQVARLLPQELPVSPTPSRPIISLPRDKASLKAVIDAGLLKTPLKLTVSYKGTGLEAELRPDGTVRFHGKSYQSCSAAGTAAKHSVTGETKATNGWAFWQYRNANGRLVPLISARREYQRRSVQR